LARTQVLNRVAHGGLALIRFKAGERMSVPGLSRIESEAHQISETANVDQKASAVSGLRGRHFGALPWPRGDDKGELEARGGVAGSAGLGRPECPI